MVRSTRGDSPSLQAGMKRTRPPVRLMPKRVCWLLIDVARQDAETLQPLESLAVGLAAIL